MTSEPPVTPGEWLELARSVHRDNVETLRRFDVSTARRLRIVEGDQACPYYEPVSQTIGLAVPDTETVQGRIWWLFLARMWGVEGVDQARQALFELFPFLMAHELAHHLRHHYEALTDNDFVEEQVANVLGIALVAEQPAYGETLTRVRHLARNAAQVLGKAAPEAAARASGYHQELEEVLRAEGALGAREAKGVRLLAESLGEPLEEVLEAAGVASDSELRRAEADRAETETYFRSHYMASLFEYWLFGNEWLRTYLERNDLPPLGTAIDRYLLTRAWDEAERDATLHALTSTLRHGRAELAAAAAETLAEEGALEAVPDLARAAVSDHRTAVRTAALRALGTLAPSDPASPAAAEQASTAPESAVRAAAAALLVRGATRAAAGRDRLNELLAGDAAERAAALAEVAELADPSFRQALVTAGGEAEAELRALALHGLRRLAAPEGRALALSALTDEDAVVRRAAVELLATLTGDVPELARMLDDPAAAVRAAAAEALRGRGPDALAAVRGLEGSLRARVEAALILCEPPSPDEGHAAVRALVSELASLEEDVAAQVEGLDRHDPRERLLREALEEERRRLASLVLRLAGALGHPDVVALSERALASERRDAKRAAFALLRQVLPADLLPLVGPLFERPRAKPVPPAPLDRLQEYPEGLIRDLAAEVAAARDWRSTTKKEGQMLTTAERLMYLRAVPEFRRVPLRELGRLAEELVVRRYEADEVIFAAGNEDDCLYVVLSGRVVERHPRGEPAEHREYHAGQVFGETALFRWRARTTTATAIRQTTALALHRASFLRLAHEEPQILVNVLESLSEELERQPRHKA